MIYDYSKYSLLFSILFCLVVALCFCCLIIPVVLGVKDVIKHGRSYRTIVLSLAVIVLLILSVFLSIQAYAINIYNSKCSSGNYETVSGTLEIVSVTRDDYRDEEQYKIDFIVNGVRFNNLANSFSLEQKNILTDIDKDIEVRYSYINDQILIYQIVALKDE